MGQSSSTSSHIKGDDLASSFGKFFKDFKIESQILSQETITLIKTHLKEGDLQKAASAISDALRDIDNAPLNIAVTGEPGTGKSSFINALRGMEHDEEGAAPTGLPQMYLKKMKFCEYDVFIIISFTRFKISDMHLAAAIKKMKKNFYFVRTKVDNDLYNIKMSKPSTFNKDEVLQGIRNDCVTQLQNANMSDTQVFLISSLDLFSYDFQSLETTLLKKLPAYKCHIFMQYLPNVTEAAIDQKRDSVRQKVWLEAIKAGATATIPFMGLIGDKDVEKLGETLTLYRSYFGLDDASLETMAKDLNVSMEKLKANLKSPHLLTVEKEDESLGKKLLRYVEKFCSVSGGLIATGLYFRKIFYLQNYFLETVASDAKVILNKEEIFKESLGIAICVMVTTYPALVFILTY
uniref:IRG-type G domain-containing protein n=1 Tax=Canis lupus familiaris TaxID=9615 RepID=A0A8C0Q9P5_CANLF